MELNSFREILLKKAEGNPYLQTLIKYAKDELIADEVIEFLRKMAEPSAAMGRGANSALTHYASDLQDSHIAQMRDALGHHVSHYKGALKAMHSASDPGQKAKLRGVADQHLNKLVPLMHLAGRAAKHSGGKLALDYVSTTPWETNYTTTERLPNGKLKEGTKDLGRRPALKANREKNNRAVPDYRYLEMPPHSEHAGTGKMIHRGGYPFEEVRLGAPEQVSAGKGYLPIKDVKDVKEYTSHPFDMHPIHSVADFSEHELTPEHKEKVANDIGAWEDSEHHNKWLENHIAELEADPEMHEKHSSTKPDHIYEGLPLQEQPRESGSVAAQTSVAAAQAEQEDTSKAPAGAPPAIAQGWSKLDDSVKREMHKIFRGKK